MIHLPTARAVVLAATSSASVLLFCARVALAQPEVSTPPGGQDGAPAPSAGEEIEQGVVTPDEADDAATVAPTVAPSGPQEQAAAAPQAAAAAAPPPAEASAPAPQAPAQPQGIQSKAPATGGQKPEQAQPAPSELVKTIGGFGQIEYLRRDISEDELSAGTGAPLNEDQFSVRRARLYAGADYRWLGASGELELFGPGRSGAVVRPIVFEAHAQYKPRPDKGPYVGVRAGLFPVPFGFENYEELHNKRFFGEQTLFSNSLVPGRTDLGVAAFGEFGSLNWAIAAQNGQPIDARDFAYRDPNRAKDFAGRVQFRSGDLFAIAISGLQGRGFSPGTQPTKDSFEWRDLNEDGRVTVSELVPVPGSAGRPSKSYRRWAVGADIQLRIELPPGKLMIYGEAAIASNMDRAIAPADPVLLGRDQRGFGWYVAVVQDVTRYASVGVRYERYEPNVDWLEPFEGTVVVARRKFDTVSAGISGQVDLPYGLRGRLLLEYEFQKNSLGRNNQGLPAQLDNDTARARLEVSF